MKLVTLRAVTVSDLNFLYNIKNNAEVQSQLLCPSRVFSKENINEWIVSYRRSQDKFLLVLVNEDDVLIGYISIQRYLSDHKTAYFGIVLDKTFQGVGYGTLSLNSLFLWGARELKLRKLLLEVSRENSKAISLYQKCNFNEIGVLKKHYVINNCYHDVILMEKEILGDLS